MSFIKEQLMFNFDNVSFGASRYKILEFAKMSTMQYIYGSDAELFVKSKGFTPCVLFCSQS